MLNGVTFIKLNGLIYDIKWFNLLFLSLIRGVKANFMAIDNEYILSEINIVYMELPILSVVD